MDKELRKELAPMLTPHYNVADSIPIRDVAESGILETRKGLFSRTYRLADVNFSVAQRVEKGEMYLAWRDFLNALDPAQTLQVTIWTHRISSDADAKSVLLPEIGDGYDTLRAAYNQIILANAKAGSNGIRKDKYVTLSQECTDMAAAERQFAVAEADFLPGIDRVQGASLTPLSLYERLNLLRGIYNPSADETEFSEYATVSGRRIKAFSLDEMYRQGLSVKSIIAPPSMEIRSTYFRVGERYGRVMNLEAMGRTVKDSILNDLTNLDFDALLSVNISMIEKASAYRMVDRKLTNSEAELVEIQSKSGILSHRVEADQAELKGLMDDLNQRDQNLLNVRIHICFFADSLEHLRNEEEKIKTIVRAKGMNFVTATDMQEQAMVSAMPYGYDCSGCFRTLNSDAAAAFLPFSAQELQTRRTKQSIPQYYGINKVTKSIIAYDRFLGDSYNALIFGFTGSGKSMTAKLNILNTLLTDPDADVIILDPNDEYLALTKAMGGQAIEVIGSGKQRINPFEISDGYGSDDQDPVAAKIDFLQSMCQVMIGQTVSLTAIQRNAIIMAGKEIYDAWVKSGKDDRYVPTLQDFYDEISNRRDAGSVADIYELAQTVERFTDHGVDKIFSGKSNVQISNRFVDFAIGELGDDLKPLAMLILLDHVWGRMAKNRREKRKTYIYIDELHLLMQSEMVAGYLQKIWKICRKYNGAPCGITQNVEDILSSPAGRGIVNNTPFIIMLKESMLDRTALANMFNLSPTLLSFITNSRPGEGLLYVQSSMAMATSAVIPFKNAVPEDNDIYRLITTKITKD